MVSSFSESRSATISPADLVMPIPTPLTTRACREFLADDRHNGEVGILVIVPTSAQASAPSCSRGRARPGGVPLPVIQRQLGHSYVSTTSVYLQGIDVEEIIGTVYARRAPMMHVSAGLEF